MHAPAATRLAAARDAQAATDYHLAFWSQLGWTLLTCGFYGFYVHYKLMERMREHNRRRLAFLEAANEVAWERAVAHGRDAELRARFERVATDLEVLRRLTGEFRDPGIWLVILIVGSTVAQAVMYVLLDQDLVKHGAAEADAERELGDLFAALGLPIAAPPAEPPKEPHRYPLRVVAFVATCGVYGLWWLYDAAVEPNRHFARDHAWEDAVVRAVA